MKRVMYVLSTVMLMAVLFTGCQTKEVNVDFNENGENQGENQDADTITITHEKGTVTLPAEIQKAVIFDFGILDTMDSLGVEVEIAAPVSSLPTYLEHYNDVTNAGGIKEPDLEAIFDFEPDVIFISGRQEAYYDQLSEIAPTIFVQLNGDTYMEDFKTNVDYVAEVFNKKEEAASAFEEVENQIEAVKAVAGNSEEKALVLLTNDGSMSVYGYGSRFGIIHDVLGVKAADPQIETSTHGQSINYEYIAEINPDLIFVIDRTVVAGGSNTAVTVLDNAMVNGTNAAKNDNIISLNPDTWYLSGGGISSVTQMVQEIGQVLQ